MKRISGILITIFALSNVAFADDTNISKIVSFLENNIEDRAMDSNVVEYVIEEGRLVGETSGQKTITAVTYKSGTLKFKLISLQKRNLYKLNSDGTKVFWKNEDSFSVTDYIYSVRKSTGEVKGISFATFDTGWEYGGTIKLKNNNLVISSRNTGDYVDGYSADGNGWKPAVFFTKYTFSFDGEKSALENNVIAHDFDLNSGMSAEPYANISTEFTQK